MTPEQKRLKKQWAKRPPNFRTTLPEKRCGNCRYWGTDQDDVEKCLRYPNFAPAWYQSWADDYADEDKCDKQVCDDWKEDWREDK